MVAIYARGNVLWIRYKFKGRHIRESLELPDTRDGWHKAEIIRLKTLADIKQKRMEYFAGFVSLNTAMDEFFVFKQGDNKRMDLYETAIKHLIDYYHSPNTSVSSVTTADLKSFRNTLLYNKKFSPNTVYTYFRHLKTFFNYCQSKQYIQSNPVPKIKPGKIDKRVIPESIMHKVLWYLRLHNRQQYNCIKLYHLTGLRKNELLSLRWSDVDLDNRIIYINNTKGNRIDKFPITNQLYNFLSGLPAKQGRIIKYSPNGLRFWNRTLARLKLPRYSLHDIRRTFATRMAYILAPYELNKLMRHKNIQTTLKFYTDVDLQKIREKMQ